MADTWDKFSIGIDADVSALQSSLKAAQNTLAQFESALKKATNIGEINYLNRNIDNLKGTIAQLNQQAGRLGKPMGDASQSLINFSRIAQDAPYGIMGVANNLNPMVESFQRLAATEGGTVNALKAMANGLIGPAGVGVAIGVVSSLAVTFSKEISEFFKGPTGELEKFREELAKVAADLNKLIGKEQTKRTQGILLAEIITGGNPTQQKEALKKLQDLYKDNEAIQKAKLGNDKKYYQTLVNQAAMQGDAIAKEKNNTEQLDLVYQKQIENEKKRKAELDKLDRGEGLGFYKAEEGAYQKRIDFLKKQVNKKYDILGNDIKKERSILEADTFRQLSNITLVATPDKEKSKKAIDAFRENKRDLAYEYNQILRDYEKYKKKFAELDKSYVQLAPLDKEQRGIAYKREVKRATGRDESFNSLGEFLGKDAKERVKAWEIEQRKVDGLAKSYENFANMLASNVTSGLMSVWDALEQGTNPLDAIGQMFVNIAKSIAAAVIQATIFEAILTAFPELKAIFAASGALQSAFGYSGPRATGGITNGPSMALVGEAGPEAIIPLSKLSGMLKTTFNAGAMNGGGMGGNGQFVLKGNDLVLALQRSNSSLNLRRGGI